MEDPIIQRLSSLTYPGWEDDREAAERMYLDGSSSSSHDHHSSSLLQEKLTAMETKQRLHEGNRRSCPNLMALDAVAATCTYEGHERDVAQAERRLSGNCSVLQLGVSCTSWYNKLLKKQQASLGRSSSSLSLTSPSEHGTDDSSNSTTLPMASPNDRSSIPLLHQLDNLPLTYPNSDADKAVAEQYYTDFETQTRYLQKLEALLNKQRLWEGDRSHPEVQALEEQVWDYPDWHQDHDEYLQRHTGDCSLVQFGITCDFLLSKMRKKQQLHQDRASIELMANHLDALVLTYDGWEADKVQAERYWVDFSSPDRFWDKLQAMKQKQRLWSGDRSHLELVALDISRFSYPGWEADKRDCEQRHTGDCTVLQLGSFPAALQRMKKKQAHYERKFQSSATISLLDVASSSIRLRTQQQQQRFVFPSLPSATGLDSNNPATGTNTSDDQEEEPSQNCTTEDKKCVVCLECEPRFAFVPCGHLCVCSGCANTLEEREGPLQCPMCRETALVLTRIYA